MVLLGCFVAQTRGVMFARAGDNVVFVREPCNLFDSSCMKVGPRGHVYYKSVRYSARKCSVFWRIMQLLRNICDITMNRC